MSKPKPRTWTVEERVLTDRDSGEQWVGIDRAEAQEAYLECEAIQHRLGGAIIIAPDREQQPDGTFRTRRLVFRYESFVPARRPEPVAEEPQEEELPEEIVDEPVEDIAA